MKNQLKKNELIKSLDVIAADKVFWHNNTYVTSNIQLYELLNRCFDIYRQLQSNLSLSKYFAKQLKIKNIKCNANASLETRILRYVFRDSGDRVFLYARVLKIAASDKPRTQDMSTWIQSQNGLENISRSKNKQSPPITRSSHIINAVLHFESASSFYTITSKIPDLAPDTKATNTFSLALIRQNSSGNSEIIYGSHNKALINSVLVDAGRTFSSKKADSKISAKVVANNNNVASAIVSAISLSASKSGSF